MINLFEVFKFLLNLGLKLLDLIPEVSLTIPDDMLGSVAFIFQGIAFFLPIGTLSALFSFKLVVWGLRMALAIMRFIRDFIPF